MVACGTALSGTSPPTEQITWTGKLTLIERANIDWITSTRSAILIAIPVALALATGLVTQGVFAAIGCFNVAILQFEGTANDRLRRSCWGLVLNSIAIALGTLVGTAGILAIPLVAVGLILAHFVTRVPRSGALLLTVSAVFVIGVGLPVVTLSEAGIRALLLLLGGGLGVAGLAIHVGVFRRLGKSDVELRPVGGGNSRPVFSSRLSAVVAEWGHAIAVGVTAAAGLAIATWAGFARDYWVMLTIVVVLRPKIEDTLTTGVARMVGTVVGAAVAVLVTAGLPNSDLQGVLIVVFVFGAFVFIGVNYTLYAISLTAFVIILLNLVYPGGLLLAETRVLDTVVGGLLALAVATFLWAIRVWPLRPAVSAPSR
jgi:hypothetical protein